MRPGDTDDDERTRDAAEEESPVEVLDALLQTDPAPLPPIAPDGGFVPQIMGEATPIPEATPENFICVNGPCRHYVEQVVWFPAGNTEGSPGCDAKEIVRYCDRLRSAHIALTDELIHDCNAWDPILPEDLVRIKSLRANFPPVAARDNQEAK